MAESKRKKHFEDSGSFEKAKHFEKSRDFVDFGHFLQSHEWEKFEQLEGETTFWLEGEGWHALALLKQTPLGNYLYLPYGPAIQDASRLEVALEELKKLAKEQQAFFIRIEPTLPLRNEGGRDTDEKSGSNKGEECLTDTELKRLGLKKSHDIDPANTWVMDLPETEQEFWTKMQKSRARYWRNASKIGLEFRTSKDPEEIGILSDLLAKMSKKLHFNPQDQEHLKNQLRAGFATLYIAELNKKPIAAALVYDYGDTRFGVHAADDPEYHNLRAGARLTVQKIFDAQVAGKKIYDFWGITTSNNPKHPWYGFTKYKKTYTGRQVDYAGTWDLPLNPVKYSAYQILRKINRIRRRAH